MGRAAIWSGVAFALALTVMAPPAALAAPPAHLQFANFVMPARDLTVRVCPSAGGACRTTVVRAGRVGSELILPAARYRISASRAGRRLAEMIYGLGKGGHFILTFYGVASAHGDGVSFWQRLRQALSGVDARSFNGYRVAHRMILLRQGRTEDPARVRAANLVPFAAGLSLRLATDGGQTRIGPLPYAALSPARPVEGTRALLSVRPEGSNLVLAERPVVLPAGSSTVVFVVTGTNGRVGTVVARFRREGRK